MSSVNALVSISQRKHIKHHFPQVEVIAGGGIDSLEDIQNYANIGADHVSLGTVCFNPLKLRKLV